MSDPFVGVQLGSHSVFDEGAEHCLDILRETADVETVFVYSHTYQNYARGRNADAIAPDHGVAVRDPQQRQLTNVWTTHHDERFGGTSLRHHPLPGREEYAGRDVFAELIGPARERGMKVYARILEGHGPELTRAIPNWVKVLTVDAYGRLQHLPCWNNPEYRNFWISTVEDLFATHELDGLQWGSERVGPLSNLLMKQPHVSNAPVCFCDHCVARGRHAGIDVERARAGFRELHEMISGLDDAAAPSDGVLVTVLRKLLMNPEILQWQQVWRAGRDEVAQRIYGAVKALRPEAEVGLHIDHQGTSWDVIARAETPYEDMANYADFIKPIVYHDIAGPRIRRWFLDRVHGGIFQELPLPMLLELYYRVFGYDPETEPSLDEMDNTGFSTEYVYRETKRTVQGVKGKAKVYAGVGFDVPWKSGPWPADPDTVTQATRRAFDAGADGIVISREYDEMRLDNLRAVGKAVREVKGRG
ncbi:MAG: hypothetical protein ACLFV3_05345 [Phycisphaeraceae bacterium]